MRTKAIQVVPFFMLILLTPASSSDNSTHSYPTSQNSTLAENMATSTSTEARLSKQNSSFTATTTEVVLKNGTTPASLSPTLPSTLATSTKHFPHSSQLTPSVSATTQNTTSSTEGTKTWLILLLLAIMVLAVFVGCVHSMKNRQSGQDSSVPRLLLDVRERIRTEISNVEDRMGVRLWPGGKRGEEDDVEEAEGRQAQKEGQRRDAGGEGLVSNNEKQEHKEEDSETSDDYSSMEGSDLRERALNRQKEEERSKSKNGEDTSSASDGDQSVEEGQSNGNKKGGSEEIALVNSPQEDDENIDLCDVTAL